jgi:hypothetical protein
MSNNEANCAKAEANCAKAEHPTPWPRVGQMVQFHAPEGTESNGMRIMAAVVTRVWNRDMVNLTVFPDFDVPKVWSSVSRAYYNGASWGFVE